MDCRQHKVDGSRRHCRTSAAVGNFARSSVHRASMLNADLSEAREGCILSGHRRYHCYRALYLGG